MEMHDHVGQATKAPPAGAARVPAARACAAVLVAVAALAAVLANRAPTPVPGAEELPVQTDVASPTTLPLPAIEVMYENPDARWAPASELAATATLVPVPDLQTSATAEAAVGRATAALVPAPPGADGGGAGG